MGMNMNIDGMLKGAHALCSRSSKGLACLNGNMNMGMNTDGCKAEGMRRGF